MDAAKLIVDALKDPALTPEQRAGLVASLQALTSGAPAPTKRGRMRAQQRQRLTRTSVEALPLPPSGEQLVFDDLQPQLAVRLRPSGRSYIVVKWDRELRRKVSHTIGRTMHYTPEQARHKAQELIGMAAAGEDIRRSRETGTTLRELIAAWHAEKHGRRTADELRDKALAYLGPLADRPAREIEREEIGAIHHRIATKARKQVRKRIGDEVRAVETGKEGLPATADKWRATIHAVYAWAQAKGLVADNPAEGIKHAFDAKQAARTNYLHGDALLRFWRALDADADADVRDVIKLLIYTGQRRGNVLAMRWGDLDLQAGLWTLHATDTKQKRAQTTPLSAPAREILQQRQAEGPWVFPAVRASADGTLGPISETRLRDAWARICRAAGIDDLRPHDLRHTAGSWLARLGANEAVRQKALGHQTPAMAARYSHLALDPVAEALERMGAAITAAAKA
jgi:integrase